MIPYIGVIQAPMIILVSPALKGCVKIENAGAFKSCVPTPERGNEGFAGSITLLTRAWQHGEGFLSPRGTILERHNALKFRIWYNSFLKIL